MVAGGVKDEAISSNLEVSSKSLTPSSGNSSRTTLALICEDIGVKVTEEVGADGDTILAFSKLYFLLLICFCFL